MKMLTIANIALLKLLFLFVSRNFRVILYYVFYKYSLFYRNKYIICVLSTENINNLVGYYGKSPLPDINNCVIVGRRSLVNISDGLCAMTLSTTNNYKCERNVWVYYRKASYNNLYVTPVLFKNWNLQFVQYDCVLKPLEMFEMNFAEKVQLTMLSHFEFTLNDQNVTALLEAYFTIAKICVEGDIIAMTVKTYGKDVFYNSTKFNDANACVYFVCSRLDCKDSSNSLVFCCVDKTDISLGKQFNTRTPKLFRDIPTIADTYHEDLLNEVALYLDNFDDYKLLNIIPIMLIEYNRGAELEKEWNNFCTRLGFRLSVLQPFEIFSSISSQTETKIRLFIAKIKQALPCVIVIENIEMLGRNADGIHDPRIGSCFVNEINQLLCCSTLPFYIICCSTNADKISPLFKSLFVRTFQANVMPTPTERRIVIRDLLKRYAVKKCSADLSDMVLNTKGFLYGDLDALVYHGITHQSLPGYFTDSDFAYALGKVQSTQNQIMGTPKSLAVCLSDVGGLEHAKKHILSTIKLSLRHADILQKTGLRRCGLLLFGPPGTGKTLLVKAVASELAFGFISVKGPEVLNMYVGQSEQNIRDVFKKARESAPCIIFFDELDAIAPQRGLMSDCGGVMDRVISQLLAELDSLSDCSDVLVIGATNRPELIDNALLRPGRLDKMIYIGIPKDIDSKMAVLKAQTKRFSLSADVNLRSIAEELPPNFSGADIYGMCCLAWMSAARKTIDSYESMQSDCPLQQVISVSKSDLLCAMKLIKPTCSVQEIESLDHFASNVSHNQ